VILTFGAPWELERWEGARVRAWVPLAGEPGIGRTGRAVGRMAQAGEGEVESAAFVEECRLPMSLMSSSTKSRVKFPSMHARAVFGQGTSSASP